MHACVPGEGDCLLSELAFCGHFNNQLMSLTMTRGGKLHDGGMMLPDSHTCPVAADVALLQPLVWSY